MQWLRADDGDSCLLMRRIVPVAFSLQAVKTVPVSVVVAYAMPPATAKIARTDMARRAPRRRKIALMGIPLSRGGSPPGRALHGTSRNTTTRAPVGRADAGTEADTMSCAQPAPVAQWIEQRFP